MANRNKAKSDEEMEQFETPMEMLEADHGKVKALFEKFESAGDRMTKAKQQKQSPRSPRRNGLPVKRINGTLLMGHKYLAGAFVKLHQVAKAASCPNRALHHPPEAFDGVEMVPTMGG